MADSARDRAVSPRCYAVLATACAVVLLVPASAPADRAADFPDPGGDESASLELTKIAPKLVGANDDFPLSVAAHEASIGKLAKAGLSAVRRTLSWRALESVPGVWNETHWAQADSFYRATLANSMEPVMILGFAPYWAWSGEDQLACPTGNCTRPPADTDAANGAWQRFVAEAAKRFPKATFEVWNEPNTPEFWGSAPDPERWAEIVRLTYPVIKDIAPGARVIVCGCAGITAMSAETGAMQAAEFLRRALAAPDSIAGHYDAISLHFFPQAYWPFIPFEFGVASHLAELLQGVRSVLSEAGQAGSPLWFDEVGYWTEDPGAPHWAVSELDAARGVAKLVRRLITMADVDAVLIHRAIDAPISDPSNHFQVRNSTFGLMRRTELLEAKPSFCALAAMSASWDGSDPACEEVDLSEPEPPAPVPESPAPEPEPPAPVPDPPAPVPNPQPEPDPDPERVSDPAPNPVSPAGAKTAGCEIVGTPGDDVLIGTGGDDVICGLGGNDVIRGKGGNDHLRGGKGRDRLLGGAGNDRLDGQRGDDLLQGRRGSDALFGRKGNDRLVPGRGRDRISPGSGSDRIVRR